MHRLAWDAAAIAGSPAAAVAAADAADAGRLLLLTSVVYGLAKDGPDAFLPHVNYALQPSDEWLDAL